VNILFASLIEKPERWLPLLERALPQDRFFTEPDGSIDVVLVATPPAGTFLKMKSLKLIQSMWMGVEKLLEDPSVPKSVPMARLVDPGMVAAMSETVLVHTLDWHRHLYRYRAQQPAQQWKRYEQALASDRTIGILGIGELGTDAAQKLVSLGFNVRGWSRRPKTIHSVETFSGSDGLGRMIEKCDALVCLLPLTAHTRGVLNRDVFSKMKPGGCVINVARGGHVVVPELIGALDSGQLAHAYLDVFDVEPLAADSPLWRHPGVTVTPHAAALTEPRTAVARIAANIERLRRGEALLNLVDRAAGY
jgi:glyoxylate/hydroxypyruvate reductase A